MKYLTTDDLVINILFWNSIIIMETFKQGLFISIVTVFGVKINWFLIFNISNGCQIIRAA